MPLENKPTEIHITIDAEGGTTIEVHGVQGTGCTALSKPYRDLFEITAEVNTSEYYQTQPEQQRRQQRL